MVLVVPEQSQRPYRFGMTLLCVGALFNWLGLADTYSDPVPAIRYIGVGLIAAGASLICMAMCFWMRNIHDPNNNGDYDISPDPIHIIPSDPSLEKPPEYSTVVDVPPCYEDAIKLNATPIVLRLKQALATSGHLLHQNSETNGAASKNSAERNHSLPSALAVVDDEDFGTPTANARQTEKSAQVAAALTPATSVPLQNQNSSQNENTLAKVFRKSIRGIRRFRTGSEDSNNSLGQESVNLESGSVHETNVAEAESAKVDR